MTTFIMVQARQGSRRFKNKVLCKINNNELIKIQFQRLKKIKSNKKIFFLIPKKNNQELKKFLIQNKINFFQGNENDVLSRYFNAAKNLKAKKIIRLTGDCPLIDFRLIDRLIKTIELSNSDYMSNTIKRSFPHGMDMEIFTFKTLEKINFLAKTQYDREHVTSYLTKNQNSFLIKNFTKLKRESKFRITVDYKEDLAVIRNIVNYFKPNIFFSSKQIVNFLKKNPNVSKLNSIHKIY